MTNYFDSLYRVRPDTRLGVEEFNARFRSLDARLGQIESVVLGLDDVKAELRADGVNRLTDALQDTLPGIIEDAQSGYLTGLANDSVSWVKVDKSGAIAGDVGAASQTAFNNHVNGPNAHALSQISGLQTALNSKQNYSALLQAIATDTPINNSVIAGTGSSFQTEELIAGVGISFDRDVANGTWTINALNADGSVQGEANTVSNIGNGVAVFAEKAGVDLRFKTLVAGSGLTLSASSDELTFGLDPGQITIPIASVTNLSEELGGKQSASALLSAIAGSSTAQNGLLRWRDGQPQWAQLQAGSNISISQQGGAVEISAAAAGENNTGENIGSGTGLFSGKSGTTLQFRSLVSLTPAIAVSSTSNSVRFGLSLSEVASGFANNAIAWTKVNKSGAAPGDVGAEPAGAVSTHANGSGVHSIAAVSGLQSALNDRLLRSSGATQEMNASIAIQPTTANIGSYTPNAAGQNYWVLTQTSNSTINNPSNLTSNRVQFLDFTVIQDGTGGRSLSWGSNFVWGDGPAPIHKTDPNAVNIYTFKSWGGSLYFLGHRAY